MLFINDDEAEILHRSEDARTGSDHHSRLPFADAAPLLGALGIMKSRVENRDPSPNRWKNWPAIAGVNAISGTSSSALRPSARVASMALR